MKNYIYLIVPILVVLFIACVEEFTEFLEKPPGVDVTEDVLFSSRVQLDTYIASTYRFGIHSPYPMDEGLFRPNPRPFTLNAGITDEAESEVTFVHTQGWNTASINANNNPQGGEDFYFHVRWRSIRNTNILLERVDEVPDADESYKSLVKGEAHFIRGLNYLEMLKRYGGVPIVAARFQLTDDFFLGRNTVSEVLDFILENADMAIALLPESHPSNQIGRATKSAARMMKSRALLYAASPLFNTSQPYLEFGANNNLICLGNEDINRWQLAANAAKEVIDFAAEGGFSLVTDRGPENNYKYVWEQPDNREIILANKIAPNRGWWQFPWAGLVPTAIDNSWTGVSIIHNFVRKYEKRDGSPQDWDPNGGENLTEMYAELDPRFAQTVGYNGSYFNQEHPILETYQGGRHASQNVGGAWLKKMIPDQYCTCRQTTPNGIVFRLAEAYLNFAEALNEAQGPVKEAYDAVNVIRERSGMPNLPGGLSQDEFRSRVRNERDLELAFEDHRLWDIRRWMIAEENGVMQGEFYGLRIFQIPGSTEFRYEPYVFETRTFNRNMYLHPFSQNEINKDYIIQNPGW